MSVAPEKTTQQQLGEGAANTDFDIRQFLNFKSMQEVAAKQSVVCDEAERVRCSPMVKDGKLLEYVYADARTQHEIFLRGLRESKNGACLGYRPGPDQPYTWFSYKEVLERAQHVGSGLIAKGAEAKNSQLIGVFSQNRVEYSLVEQACNAYSMVVVPLYDTLGAQAIRHIVNLCELDYVVADTNTKVMGLLSDDQISVKMIISMEAPSDETKEAANKRGTEVVSFAEVENLGMQDPKDFVPPSPDDLHTICFTSGTTGNPKGVMLTHGTLIAGFSATYAHGMDEHIKVGPDDVHISYLPMAHIFEKLVQAIIFMRGARIGFFQGDIKLLLGDIAALKPTIFPLVPRLMNRIYDTVWARVSGSRLKKFMLERAVKAKTDDLKRGIVSQSTFWDLVLFRRVRNMLGGRVRICVTGAAPISATVLNFMRCALGVHLTEGYGQTEATGAISATVPIDYAGGNVGSIIPSCLVKLVDVPEKNYYAKDNKGEVCVKGTSIFSGYYKEEEKTKEAIDEDGWLHTGDVGEWLPNGSLKIFDRSKHIFKLAQGEYIAPEKIEQIYVQSAPVAQVFVHGESLKATLVAVVIPNPETIVGWCKGKQITGSYEEICKNERAAEEILKAMNIVGKKNGLQSFELAKRIHLSDEMFTVQNDLLTPTFKSRRPQLLARYKDAIDKMYDGLD